MPYFMLFNIKYLDIAIFWKPSIVFFVKTLACLKYLRTFAPLFYHCDGSLAVTDI